MIPYLVKIFGIAGICAAISAGLYYILNYTNPTFSTGITLLLQMIMVVTGMFAVLLLLGYYARRAGFSEDELEKWGDEAMQGKPPI